MSTIEKVIPVLDTRNVLVEHLTAKVVPQFTSKYRAVEAVLEISGNLRNQDIIPLLEDEEKLIQAVSHSSWYRREKEELGEELFSKVSEIEPDLSSKITGMLLELDNQTIRQLFESEDLLIKAVEKSKEEYVIYKEESEVKEEIGEELYSRISNIYAPEVASHLTGMLLELQSKDLKILLTNQKELESKLKLAYDTYLKHCSS
uniref:PABC domain-containing protein n=1 Tax=Lygus hesperus TaxID=30085 RepID=A0A0K8S7V5_LYGHE